MPKPAPKYPRTTEPRPGGVLVLNAGSTSLKFAIYPPRETATPLLRGKITDIGHGTATLHLQRSNDPRAHSPAIHQRETLSALDHHGALCEVFHACGDSLTDLAAIGHRVVHGGPHFSGPTLVSPDTLERLRALEPYDPAHQAVELAYIEAVAQRWPYLPQIVCFDTTFHQTMPRIAQRLPVSDADAALGLRRYGFHGLSYAHALQQLRAEEGERATGGRVILAHLGGGASLAAVRAGRCVDTTMGLTPTGGVPMGSRSGDVDPGVVLWLARQHGLNPEGIFEWLTQKSGLLALSGWSADISALLRREHDDARAATAVSVYCYHLRKAIGALAAALGGVDVLVFTGGVGEHQPAIRQRVVSELGFLGIEIDPARNIANVATISPPGSRVGVRVIAADEERMIAAAVSDVLYRPSNAA